MIFGSEYYFYISVLMGAILGVFLAPSTAITVIVWLRSPMNRYNTNVCTCCGANMDYGSIFCKKCGIKRNQRSISARNKVKLLLLWICNCSLMLLAMLVFIGFLLFSTSDNLIRSESNITSYIRSLNGDHNIWALMRMRRLIDDLYYITYMMFIAILPIIGIITGTTIIFTKKIIRMIPTQDPSSPQAGKRGETIRNTSDI